jgi:hypothetical protein
MAKVLQRAKDLQYLSVARCKKLSGAALMPVELTFPSSTLFLLSYYIVFCRVLSGVGTYMTAAIGSEWLAPGAQSAQLWSRGVCPSRAIGRFVLSYHRNSAVLSILICSASMCVVLSLRL